MTATKDSSAEGALSRPTAGTGYLANTHPALRHCWHPVARADEVLEVPHRALLLGEALALVRLDGAPVVFYDSCPHRLAPLSAGRVTGGLLECAYHGWQFAGDGRCVTVPSLGSDRPIPPRAHLAPPLIEERDGLVYVCLDEPVTPIPTPADEPDARRVDLVYEGTFGAAMLIDNQLDIAHFPFVHRATFGSPDGTQVPSYDVERAGWGFRTKVPIPFTAANDREALAGRRPLAQLRRMTYRYAAPFFVDLHIEYPESGGAMRVVFHAQPETEERARLYVSLYFTTPGGLEDEELAERVAFEERVIAEDLELQARFVTRAMPIDQRIECHVRADRQSLEFRRILTELTVATAATDEVMGKSLQGVAS